MKVVVSDRWPDRPDPADRSARIALILCFSIPGFAAVYFVALYLIGSR